MDFEPFQKIARLSRDIVITEKIDGTNAQIFIDDNGTIQAGSRNRWLTVDSDNFGFAAWVEKNKIDLLQLGPGRHFGEWWGAGIQRRYGLDEKRFSLFNVSRHTESRPNCCNIVPVLYTGPFEMTAITESLNRLATDGSLASPGFKPAEGIVVFHTASGQLFKKTILDDEKPKSKSNA